MSVRTMSLVFEYDMPELKTDDGRVVPDSTAKFVLLALADHANDEGEGAYPGVKRICKKTSMSTQTVCNALNALRHNEYTTLNGKSKVDTNSYTINIKKLFQPLGFQPIESGDSSDENSKTPTARVKPSFNHQINQKGEGVLTPKDYEQANAKVDAMIANQKKATYQNRDKIPDALLEYCDLYFELTGQQPTKRVLHLWLMDFNDWITEGLLEKDVRAAYKHATRPDGGFLVGRPGSLTNTAVAMKSRARVVSTRKSDDGTDHRKYLVD